MNKEIMNKEAMGEEDVNNQIKDKRLNQSEAPTEQAKNKCAEESDKTIRARVKLKKRLKLLEKEITTDALNNKIIEIHDRISRYATSRTVLTRKTISLFDNNQHPAKISNKISRIAQSITDNSKMFIETSYDKQSSLKNRNIDIR